MCYDEPPSISCIRAERKKWLGQAVFTLVWAVRYESCWTKKGHILIREHTGCRGELSPGQGQNTLA